MQQQLYAKRQVFATLAMLWAAHFAIDFMLGIWSIYKTIAHLDLATAGFIAGFCALLGEGSQVITGTLSDRGYRKQLLSFAIAASCTSVFLSYTVNYYLLFLFYLITCLSSGAFHPTAVGVIGSFKEQNKNLAIAGFTAFGALGMAVSQLIFSHAYTALDGETVWLAIPSLVLFLFFIGYKLALQPTSSHETSPSSHTPKFSDYLGFFKNRALSYLFISQVCNQAVFWSTIFLLPDVLICREYDSWICYGGGHMVFILGASAMMIPGGYLANRFSSKWVIVSATACAICLYFFFFAIPLLPTAAVIPVLALLGGVMGMVNPVSVAFGVELAPEKPSMVSAFLMGFVWCISEPLGQTGGGFLTNFFIDDSPARALVIVNGLLLIGLYAALRLPKTSPSPAYLNS